MRLRGSCCHPHPLRFLGELLAHDHHALAGLHVKPSNVAFLGVAVVAAGAYLLATLPGIEGGVRPFDFGALAHATILVSLGR